MRSVWASTAVAILGVLAFILGLFLIKSGLSIGVLVSLVGASTAITVSVYGVRSYRNHK